MLARHFSNESLTAGQRQELEAWIRHNRSEYERLKKFTDRMAVLPEQVHFDADQAWKKLNPELTANLIPFKRKKHFLTYASVAVSLLILLSVATVWLIQRTDPDPLLYRKPYPDRPTHPSAGQFGSYPLSSSPNKFQGNPGNPARPIRRKSILPGQESSRKAV